MSRQQCPPAAGSATFYGGKTVLDSPLFAGRVSGYDDAVGVGHNEVARVQPNRLRPVDGFGIESGGRRAGSEPGDRAVAADHHGGIVARIYIVQCPRMFVLWEM